MTKFVEKFQVRAADVIVSPAIAVGCLLFCSACSLVPAGSQFEAAATTIVREAAFER
jgi:hypothetical protein